MYYKCNEILVNYYWSMHFSSFLTDLNVKNYHLQKNKKHLAPSLTGFQQSNYTIHGGHQN